jgi:hypothetical protein
MMRARLGRLEHVVGRLLQPAPATRGPRPGPGNIAARPARVTDAGTVLRHA